jgi:hypothetical protein
MPLCPSQSLKQGVAHLIKNYGVIVMAEQCPIYAVYAPGKAATSTTHDTLQAALDSPVYNIRVGTPEGIKAYSEYFQQRFGRPLRTDELAFNQARVDNPDAPLKPITLTREPVAAAVSNWFYGFERNHSGENPANWSLDQHREAIVDGDYAHRKNYFTGWLDFELEPFAGIDVYQKPFSTERSYEMYESGTKNASLLLMRSEALSRILRIALRTFVGVNIERIDSCNTGEASSYAEVYRQFKANPRLPTEFIDEQHSTKFATTFYARAELIAARNAWTSGTVPG